MRKWFSVLLWGIFAVVIASICLPGGVTLYREWLNPIFSFHVKDGTMVLSEGESKKIKVVAVNQRVSFQSKDFKIASVDRNGKVVGKRTGSTVIYIKGEKTLLCKVTVVSLNKKEVRLKEGGHVTLRVKGTWSRTQFKSTNKEVAAVNYRGRVTAKKKGSCKIICKVKGKKLECIIQVK